MNKRSVVILAAGLLIGSVAVARDLETLQRNFLSWKFGMFMHFNMSTFVPGGWSSGKEDPLLFNPENLDFGQWADAAVAAKMKYAVLTVKHTGGWCLWDTATADRDITWFKNYKDGKADIVKEYVDAFRSRDLKVGFYYCFPLWGGDKWKDYQTLPHDDYALGTVDALTMIKTHFTELLSNYGDIDIIWIDQSGSPNGGLKPGDWRKIKAHMHSLQPSCLVIANNATSLEDSDLFGYEYPYSLELPSVTNTVATEVCDKLNNGWFANPDAPCTPVRNVDYIVNKMLRPLNDRNANLLLNCAPEKTGRLHPETVAVLEEVGRIWDPSELSHKDSELYDITREAIQKVPTRGRSASILFPPNLTAEQMQKAVYLLNYNDAKGTFFINEATAKTEKGLLRILVAAGHELGNGSKSAAVISGKKNARLVRNEVDAVQKQLRAVKSPVVFRAPEFKYDDYTWAVLNYLGLTAIEPSPEPASGVMVEVNSTDQLEDVLAAFKKKGLKAVTVRELMNGSSSERLRIAATGGADVVTGRE
ncbi:MAG: alpha-L-fucosidase [Kiritimatiellae bacterium]|nr:alpha-L-fucosidase [Kiritimatiellia bacterium]